MMRAAASALAALLGAASALDDGLALRPPMGWRSWNLFGEKVSQQLLERIMDATVVRARKADGKLTSLKDLGYTDVGLDDGWQLCGAGDHGYQYHTGEGKSIVNSDRFPDMAGMTAHAHKLGLTAGWYHNNCICREIKVPTMAMYEQDARRLAHEFHFDGLKLDGCGTQYDLQLWSHLLNKTGRPVIIENCHWGLTLPTATWCPWHFYRTSPDVRASYGSVLWNLQTVLPLADQGLSRPGCWAYPDMLQVGVKDGPGGYQDPGLSLAEARSHFGTWCIVSAPLILGMDITKDAVMDEVWPLISNTEAIGVNQAWAGHSGSAFKRSWDDVLLVVPLNHDLNMPMPFPSWQFFHKPLGGGRFAVLLLNNNYWPQTLHLQIKDIPGFGHCPCHVRDVWKHQTTALASGDISVTVASHDCAFLILEPAAPAAVQFV